MARSSRISLWSWSYSSTANCLRLLMDRRVLVREAPVCAFLLLSMTLVGEEIMPTAEKGWALRGEENRERDGGPVPKCGR